MHSLMMVGFFEYLLVEKVIGEIFQSMVVVVVAETLQLLIVELN